LRTRLRDGEPPGDFWETQDGVDRTEAVADTRCQSGRS
jgi:hypothetical protein